MLSSQPVSAVVEVGDRRFRVTDLHHAIGHLLTLLVHSVRLWQSAHIITCNRPRIEANSSLKNVKPIEQHHNCSLIRAP